MISIKTARSTEEPLSGGYMRSARCANRAQNRKNKVLEAFAGGLPVVTNALGMQGVEGAAPGREYLAAEGAREIAAAAGRLLEDPGERRRLASAGRSLVEARYSWERQVEALLALYQSSPVAGLAT